LKSLAYNHQKCIQAVPDLPDQISRISENRTIHCYATCHHTKDTTSVKTSETRFSEACRQLPVTKCK